MAIEYEVPEGWTEEDVRRYLKPNDQSGTFALDEDVQTIDVDDMDDDGDNDNDNDKGGDR